MMTSIDNITIDFSNLDSICEAMDKYHATKASLLGKNDAGEMVLTSIYEDQIVLMTYQDNHWIRKNVYHRDGTVEEMFDGKWE